MARGQSFLTSSRAACTYLALYDEPLRRPLPYLVVPGRGPELESSATATDCVLSLQGSLCLSYGLSSAVVAPFLVMWRWWAPGPGCGAATCCNSVLGPCPRGSLAAYTLAGLVAFICSFVWGGVVQGSSGGQHRRAGRLAPSVELAALQLETQHSQVMVHPADTSIAARDTQYSSTPKF